MNSTTSASCSIEPDSRRSASCGRLSSRFSTWQENCPGLYERFPSVKRLADLVGARPAIGRIMKVNQAA